MTDAKAVARVATAIAPADSDTIIEIGPGKGALTYALRGKSAGARIIAVERDSILADELMRDLEKDSRVELVRGDILELLPSLSERLRATPYKLCGNIPYYITGHLLRVIGGLQHKPKITVLTIQKEVAERLVAEPPRMNRLAAAVQFWGEARFVGIISRKNFTPPPEVDSAIIAITTRQDIAANPHTYDILIRALFQQPRKTILNNLVSALGKDKKELVVEVLRDAGVPETDRPQNCSIEILIRLSDILSVELLKV